MDKLPLSMKNGAEEKIHALAEAYRLQEAIIHATELSIISTDTKGIITSGPPRRLPNAPQRTRHRYTRISSEHDIALCSMM